MPAGCAKSDGCSVPYGCSASTRSTTSSTLEAGERRRGAVGGVIHSERATSSSWRTDCRASASRFDGAWGVAPDTAGRRRDTRSSEKAWRLTMRSGPPSADSNTAPTVAGSLST